MNHDEKYGQRNSRIFLTPITWLIVATLTLSKISFGQCGPLFGDSNNNQYVELQDHAGFVNCFAGPVETPQPDPPQTPQRCLDVFDSDDDLDVDLLDFAEFQATFTGSGPIRAECYNRVFVSSASYPPNLGSAVAYDAQCNILASAAGFNNPAGNAFIAWVSTPSSLARTRLGQARGFVRPDGVPIADTVQSLLASNALWNPIRIDELGSDVGNKLVMTGTEFDGSASSTNCTNWTTNGNAMFTAGSTAGGPFYWTAGSGAFCNQGSFRIYCFQKTSGRALTLPPSQGKAIYLSNTPFTPGAGLAAADQICAASKPPGTGTVRALLATSGASAVSRIVPSSTFVRPDGQLVGTAIELSTASLLRSGIWQAGDGSYVVAQPAWTGSPGFAAAGTVANTCNNWTSTSSSSGIWGRPGTTEAPSWWNYSTQSCTAPQRIYCAEQ